MADNPQIFDIPIGNVKGPPGNTGNGISSIALLQTVGLDKTYRITMTDETHYDFTVTDGNGISGVTFNPETYTLTLTFDDGTSYTTGSLRGAPGAPGNDGISPAVTITTITGGHRVTITDRDHPQGQTFDVMDGAGNVTSVAGKTGAVTLDGNDVSFDQEDDYDEGTVGKALKDELNAINTKAPVIINTASGDIASFADGADDMPVKKLVGTIEPVQAAGTPSPDNILPISGWTGCNTYIAGQNILDPTDFVRGDNYVKPDVSVSGDEITFSGGTSSASWVTFCVPVKVGQKYTIVMDSATVTGSSIQFGVDFADSKPANYANGSIIHTFDQPLISKQTATKPWMLLVFKCQSGTMKGLRCMLGNDHTLPFTPYTRKTLPIAFTNPTTGDPLTIYDGTVTLNQDGSVDVIRRTNRITVPRDLSSYSKKYETGRGVGIRSLIGSGTYIQGTDSTRAMCSFTNDCRPVNKSHMTSQDWTFFKGSWTSVAEFEAVIEAIYANEELPAFVWYYKNPTTYHFDSVGQLKTFLGTNNVWIDTGSITELDYPADTKLFLTARDTEITGSIAPIENGTTASQAYAQGAYFFLNTKFCKALTAIASGATFTLNTNYTETTVAAELLDAQN